MLSKTPIYATALMLALSTATAAWGQEEGTSPLLDQALYGINSTDGHLVRYNFNTNEFIRVGSVRTADGTTLYDIEGAAYVPGFRNLFAFWIDPNDYKCKLVYVDVTKGAAAIVGDTVEGGQVTGATAYPDADGEWGIYVVQEAAVTPPFSIQGKMNINPNNRDDMQFELVRADGSTITRDDLHRDALIDGSGNYYEGDAVKIRIRPKGSGKQDNLIINGEAYPVKNSNTYTFVGDMNVRVYNDKPKGGRAMGHWWLEIIDGTANWEGDLEVTTPNRLARVDHQTGELTELFPTERAYDSLGTFDGEVFYATKNKNIYLLDPATESEMLLGTISEGEHAAVEIVNDAILVFERVTEVLQQVDEELGQAKTAQSLGARDLGTIVFTGHDQDPWEDPVSFD